MAGGGCRDCSDGRHSGLGGATAYPRASRDHGRSAWALRIARRATGVRGGGLNRWLYFALAALACAVWLSTLSGRPLFNPDEGRYAEIPREMLSGGDWVIPHLNGLDYI